MTCKIVSAVMHPMATVRKFALRLGSFALLLVIAASGQVALVPPPPPPDGSILPAAFSGWQKAPGAVIGTDPAKAAPAKASLLKEAGLISFEHASYIRQGRKITLQAFRFSDATGAFAAYSALKEGPFAVERFCDRAGSSGNRVLMACTNLVVDVTYDKVTAMAPAEMRSLVAQLPLATGNAALPASAPMYLPKDAVSDVRFALGPAGLPHTQTPLPADLIDFSKGAEVAVSHFDSPDGAAVITLVKYPTFALATDRQKAFDTFIHSRPKPAVNAPPLDTFYTRRVGPIVAVISGSISATDARSMAEKIPYDVEVTRNEPTGTQKDNIGNLVVNVVYLSFILVGFAAVIGVAFGATRILARKFFPGRFDRAEDVEFIKLDLRD